MKKFELHTQLEAAIPEASPLFGRAVRETLAALERQEMQTPKATPARPIVTKRRALVFVLAAILALAAVAAAATLLFRNVFYVTMGDTPKNAASITRYNLATETVGNAEITIKEAAYDGMSLYVLYSIRDMTATESFGVRDETTGDFYLAYDAYDKIYDLGVGWWTDSLWIDGEDIDMPAMSGGEDLPGPENGEILYYMQYRLDQVGLYLKGNAVEIAMPIGERQPFESLSVTRDPFSIVKPDKGLVTFTLDCSSHGQVTTLTPNLLTETPEWSAKVTNAVFTPLQLYVTLDWAVNPDVMAAYIAENGDGYYEDGIKYWDYGGLDVCGDQLQNLKLVDENGNPVFETMRGYYGCGGIGDTQAYYTFPYTEAYPKPLYLASETDGEFDMTRAIRIQ